MENVLNFSPSEFKHSGCYTFGGASGIRFYLSVKPSFVNRFFCKWCLGWQWEDAPQDAEETGDTAHNKPSDEICPFCRGSGEIHTMQDRETIVTKCFCKLPDKLRTSVNRGNVCLKNPLL